MFIELNELYIYFMAIARCIRKIIKLLNEYRNIQLQRDEYVK